MAIPVRQLPHLLTTDEINAWLSYYMYKDPDVAEIQMGILIAAVKNAVSSKAKAQPKDFFISGRMNEKVKKEDTDEIKLGDFRPIKKTDLHKYLKPMI